MIHLPGTLGNLDIWSHIIKYLEPSEPHDSATEDIAKRRALARTAQLSPALTDLALNALWRTMRSLVPVANIINSYALDLDEPFLVIEEIDSQDYWVSRPCSITNATPLTQFSQILTRPIIQEAHHRALGYLSRVQHFGFDSFTRSEATLWPVLGMCLGLTPTMSLLPCLQSLWLNFIDIESSTPWINSIFPLISPTLTSMTYHTAADSEFGGVECLQNILRSRSVELAHIKYYGAPSPFLLQTCVAFDRLESLKLELVIQNGESPIQPYTSKPTISDVFERLRHLKVFHIDLRLFPLHDSTNPTINIPSEALEELNLTGSLSHFDRLFQAGFESPSLLSLSVSISRTDQLVWKTLFNQISASFPQVDSLSLLVEAPRVTPLVIQDLTTFMSRPTMKSLELKEIHHSLTTTHLVELLKSWSKLNTLMIHDTDSVPFNAAELLHKLSQMLYLRCLELSLDLSSLCVPLPGGLPRSFSPLSELTITSFAQLDSNYYGRIELSRNLLILFPNLRHIHTWQSDGEPLLDEVEKYMACCRVFSTDCLHGRCLEKYGGGES